MTFSHYNKYLQKFAKENKRQLTKAEACLWKFVLSKKKMQGYRFRRQRPIDEYIVDFCCLPLKLIIEVDGYSHQLSEVGENDKVRQARLEKLGFSVLRFNGSDVLRNINLVQEQIWNWVEENK